MVVTTALNPIWLTAILLAGPLLALFSVLTGVVAWSRVTDPRVIQQVMAFIVIPIVLLGAAHVGGLFLVSLPRTLPMILPMILLGALLIALLDGALLWLVVRLFQPTGDHTGALAVAR